MVDNYSEVPKWLSSLLSVKFFNVCIIHQDSKVNVFCLDCCEGLCPHCLLIHSSHRLLQIRRYVYHDVIRLVDADKLMDCAQVQAYTTNSAKVIFLNKRPQTRAPKASGNLCITCDRNVQESSLYCSLCCKVQHLLGTGSRLSLYLRNCEFMSLPDPILDEGQMTADSVLERTGSLKTESGLSSGCPTRSINCSILTCTATTEIVRKKRSNLSGMRTGYGPACKLVSGFSYAMMNRRKGTPHRSPLH